MRPLLLALLPACAPKSPADTGDTGAVAAVGCPTDAPERQSAQLSEVRLDLSCQGDGDTTVLLLHGFPEFWMGWAPVMDRLAGDARLIAPDQRGYNTSDKPLEVDDYALDLLVGDVVELIDREGGEVVLVGHDWGGAVAWAVAARHPERVSHLVIANAPHMNVFADLLANDPEQEAAFSYVDFFVQPGSEAALVADDFAALRTMFESVLTDDEMAPYVEAWGQERAVEGGLNWYRANFPGGDPLVEEELVVDVPTTVLWGMDDTALLPQNLDGLPAYVSDLETIEVPGATHWIAHEEPDVVADAIRAAL